MKYVEIICKLFASIINDYALKKIILLTWISRHLSAFVKHMKIALMINNSMFSVSRTSCRLSDYVYVAKKL